MREPSTAESPPDASSSPPLPPAPAFAARARTAMRDGDWKGALVEWDRCLQAAGGQKKAPWLIGRAHTVRKLDRYHEAEAAFRAVLEALPGNHAAEVGLLRSIVDGCAAEGTFGERYDEILFRLRTGLLAKQDEHSRVAAIDILVAMEEITLGRQELLSNFDSIQSLEGCARCLVTIPILIERGGRPALWEKLSRVVRGIAATANEPDERIRAAYLQLCLLLALEQFDRFVELYEASDQEGVGENGFGLRAVHRRLTMPRSEVFAEPKVFGIGLSKTGTTSLTEALRILGFDAGHWANPFSGKVLSDMDFFMLGACTDISVTQNFERLHYQYPNAKFILTHRPIDSWAASFRRHQERIYRTSDVSALRSLVDTEHTFSQGFESAALHYALYLRHPSAEEAYLQHEKRVSHFFADKSGKLLVFDVFSGDGWPQLCAFLEKEMPAAEYPWSNRLSR